MTIGGEDSGEFSQEIPQRSNPSVARATGLVGFVTLFSRILGMLRDMTIASTFGAGLVSDAFLVAFRIPNLLRRVVAEGALATAFVPVFTEDLARSKEQARKTLAAVTGLALMITVPITVLGMIYATEIVEFMSPGFGAGSEKTDLAASLLIVMFPYAVLITLIALAASALNSLGAFALAAAPSILLNLVMIVSIAGFTQFFVRPIFAPAAAVVFAGLVGLGLLWRQLRQLGMTMGVLFPWRSTRTKALLLIFLPTFISSSLYQIIVFVNSLLASLLDEGSISWLYYADRIFQFPLGVFTLALSTAALPSLSRLAAEHRTEELGREVALYLSWVTFFTLPAAFSLIVFAVPITSLMYERGSFSHESVLHTASALSCYAVGLWTLSCHSVLVRAFLSLKNSTLPAVIGVLSIALNIALAFVFMGKPSAPPENFFALRIYNIQDQVGLFSFGHAGIALAGSIASIFSFYGLMAFLPRIGLNVYFEDVMPSITKSFLATLPMLIALKVLLRLDLPVPVTVILGVPGGAIVYLCAAHALHMPHTKQGIAAAQKIIKKLAN